jgi:hypothetical protein
MLVYARCALLALYWPQPVVLKRRRRAPDVGCGRARGCRRGAGTDSGDGGDVPAELRREVEEANLRMLEVRARPSMRRAGCVGPMEIETCNRRSTMLKSKKRRRCAVRAVLGPAATGGQRLHTHRSSAHPASRCMTSQVPHNRPDTGTGPGEAARPAASCTAARVPPWRGCVVACSCRLLRAACIPGLCLGLLCLGLYCQALQWRWLAAQYPNPCIASHCGP